MLISSLVVAVLGCGDNKPPRATPDARVVSPDADLVAHCTMGNADKIRFAQGDGCANDGSVEFCIPDNNAAVLSTLAGISTTITCAPGGGRANCLASPGLLLCSYPTVVPTECVTHYGSMTTAAWSNVCAISGIPEVTEIVQTILE